MCYVVILHNIFLDGIYIHYFVSDAFYKCNKKVLKSYRCQYLQHITFYDLLTKFVEYLFI